MKKNIKNGDQVFCDGAFLTRNTNAPGGWTVDSFEYDTYFDGNIVNSKVNKDGDIEYYTGESYDVSYDENDQKTYNMLFEGEIVAEILLGEDNAKKICDDISGWIDSNYEFGNVEIKNDSDKLGIIVDIFDENELLNSETFWFDDYTDE